MKHTILIFLISFLFTSYSYAFEAKVILIADGDTITVVHNGKPEKIRLYGIDTPESKQAFGSVAKNFTYAMVYHKSVNVEPVTTDRYGWTVGIVRVDGNSLSEELVKSGFAWVYDRYCKKDMCVKWQQLEEAAKQSKIGLWSQDDPVAPWVYRRKGNK
jgi:endonuclease YncB( thermonuclease family)